MKAARLFPVFAVLISGSMLSAQELEFPAPQKEHEWLKQFVGEWETDMKASFGPEQPPQECKGTIKSRALGSFWIVSEMKSEMMGMPIVAQQTLGYDPQAEEYVGTWVDSAMSHMWQYHGSVDETGKILTLDAKGPNFLRGGAPGNFRDVYEFKSPDHIVMSSSMQTEDGNWVTFMTGNARRKK